MLCATALSDDDLHPRAAALWRTIIPVIDELTEPSDAADQLLVTGGLAYGRFCVETAGCRGRAVAAPGGRAGAAPRLEIVLRGRTRDRRRELDPR